MSFLKKLGQTAINTASTIGSKSADLVEMGKLKLSKSQLEGKIKDKKTEIGELVYNAHKAGNLPDSSALQAIFNAIGDLENQISEIDSKLDQPKQDAAPTPPPYQPETPPPASAPPPPFQAGTAPGPAAPPPFQAGTAPEPAAPPPFAPEPSASSASCTNCGGSLEGGAKFCPNCGKPV